MAVLYRALGICVIFTVSITASQNRTAIPSVRTSLVPSNNATVTASPSMIIVPSYNKTVMPHSKTIVPSHNKTAMPHSKTIVPSHNKTVMPHSKTIVPSHNKTVMPHSKTIVPSYNKTAMPHSKTIVPSHNKTAMPHSKTIVPSPNTTIMPSSTHTVMPTSPAHPTLPPPRAGNFTVKENKTVCLFAYMAATFDVMMDSKGMPRIVLPVNATATGACGKSIKKPFVTLHWQTKHGSYNFTMRFANDGKRWTATNMSFLLETVVGDPVTATFHYEEGSLNELSAEVGHAYQCTSRPTGFTLIAINSTVNVSLTDIEFQPFGVKEGHLSDKVDKCRPLTTTNPPVTPATTRKKKGNVVAIAVGCTLAGLVVIVAIGYLIGRRRSRSSGGYRKL